MKINVYKLDKVWYNTILYYEAYNYTGAIDGKV
jgi:hypothetical protein